MHQFYAHSMLLEDNKPIREKAIDSYLEWD